MENENENIKWISVGSIQDFINDKSPKAIDSYFDWFISSLLANLKNYKVDKLIELNFNLFVYLLLNEKFQKTIIKLKHFLGVPLEGFKDENSAEQWNNELARAFSNYIKGEKIETKQMKRLVFLNKQIRTILKFKNKESSNWLLSNPRGIFQIIVLRRLNISSTIWTVLCQHLLFDFNPQKLLRDLSAFDVKEYDLSLDFEKNEYFGFRTIMVPLTSESTLNSILKLIESHKNEIEKQIQIAREEDVKITTETANLKRDYFVFKNYLVFKTTKSRGDTYITNKRKEEHVYDMAEKYLSEKEQEELINYDWGAMRKIVSRMKSRIKEFFLDKSDGFGILLTEMENIPQSSLRSEFRRS